MSLLKNLLTGYWVWFKSLIVSTTYSRTWGHTEWCCCLIINLLYQMIPAFFAVVVYWEDNGTQFPESNPLKKKAEPFAKTVQEIWSAVHLLLFNGFTTQKHLRRGIPLWHHNCGSTHYGSIVFITEAVSTHQQSPLTITSLVQSLCDFRCIPERVTSTVNSWRLSGRHVSHLQHVLFNNDNNNKLYF